MQPLSLRLAARCLSLAFCALAGFLCIAAVDAQIYRTVDEDGNVVFTDVPPRPEQQAETVELESGNTFTAPDASAADNDAPAWTLTYGDDDDDAETVGPSRYESVQVTYPGNDETVRENAGNLTITVQLVPDLRPGHRLQLELDGQIAQTSGVPSFQLEHLDRGTHQVRVHVLDQSGGVIMSSDPSVFHLLRYSKLTAPNRPKPGSG